MGIQAGIAQLLNWALRKSEPSAQRLSDKVRGFFISALIAAGAIEIVAAFAAADTGSRIKVATLNLMLGGAAGLSGAVIGFLFGIPRSLADGATPTDGRKSKPNTNLEQISDWLTKILVGATLTSLASVPSFLRHLAEFLDKGAYQGLPGGGTFAVIILMYFSALGFYWSYIETRTLLTILFDSYDGMVSPDVLLKVRSAPWEPGSLPIPEDSIVLGLDRSALNSAALLEARAAAETRAGNYSAAIDFYKLALAQDSGNPRIQSRLTFLLARSGDTSGADTLVQKLQDAAGANQSQRSELDVSLVYNALYKAPPAGYEEAIALGEKLIARDQASNGRLLLYLACAYGQRVRQRFPQGEPKPVVPTNDPDRVKALDYLKRMKEVNPALVPQARSNMLAENPSEADLSVFANDDDFRVLLA